MEEVKKLEQALTESVPVLEVTKTKTLKMEYVRLPITDTSVRFLYRFLEPLATIWRKGGYSALEFGYDSERPDEVRIKEVGLRAWFKMITSGMKGPLPESAQWLLEVDSCELIECEIVPKKT